MVKHSIGMMLICLFFTATGYGRERQGYVSVGLQLPELNLAVQDSGRDSDNARERDIVFYPKPETVVGLTVKYRHLSVGYSYTLTDPEEDEAKFLDYRFNLFYSWFGFDASYAEYERFRITETRGFAGELSDSQKSYPDMFLSFAAVNAYIFPLRFNYSLEQAFSVEQRKETGAALGIIVGYNDALIETDAGLVPKAWQGEFGLDGAMESASFSSVSLQAAVSLVGALGPAYVSMLYAIGAGEQSFDYEVGDEERSGGGVAEKDNLRLAAGLTGDVLFCSLQWVMESPLYKLKYMALSVESSELTLSSGVRF